MMYTSSSDNIVTTVIGIVCWRMAKRCTLTFSFSYVKFYKICNLDHSVYGLTVLNLGRFAPLTVEYSALASEIINL